MLIWFSLRKGNAVACVVRGDKQIRVCGGRSAGPAVSGHHSWDHLTNQAYPRHHVTPGPKCTHTANHFQKQWHSQGLILAGNDFRNINLWQLFSPIDFMSIYTWLSSLLLSSPCLLSSLLLSLSPLLISSLLSLSPHLCNSNPYRAIATEDAHGLQRKWLNSAQQLTTIGKDCLF